MTPPAITRELARPHGFPSSWDPLPYVLRFQYRVHSRPLDVTIQVPYRITVACSSRQVAWAFSFLGSAGAWVECSKSLPARVVAEVIGRMLDAISIGVCDLGVVETEARARPAVRWPVLATEPFLRYPD